MGARAGKGGFQNVRCRQVQRHTDHTVRVRDTQRDTERGGRQCARRRHGRQQKETDAKKEKGSGRRGGGSGRIETPGQAAAARHPV